MVRNSFLTTGVRACVVMVFAHIGSISLDPDVCADTAVSSDITLSTVSLLSSTAGTGNELLMRTILDSSGQSGAAALTIDYPPDNAVFPPEMVAPVFSWHDPSPKADKWLIAITFDNDSSISVLTDGDPLPELYIDPLCISTTNELPEYSDYALSGVNWIPSDTVWQAMKTCSIGKTATVSVYGFDTAHPDRILSKGTMRLTTSPDSVGACLFYRDVPLMPSAGEGGKIQPLGESSIKLINWRLRDISRTDSRVVMTDVPTCANCHSFSADGSVLGMDIDGPQSDKGSYTVKSVEKHMVIGHDDIISWNHLYGDKPRGQKTIGFLSQVSPGGDYAATTLNEALYVENYLDYEFLQVFYPTRGILGYWSRESGDVHALPGADNPDYVHCDPVWSPDGSYLVFARAVAKAPYAEGQKPAPYADSTVETPIRYDLCRIPFNNGCGGTPEPIAGASDNGMSNCFPKITPDGRFIIFVKCRNGQLMRPDSRLWIVPSEGGDAREMTCNTDLMNSWHTISPNGRWIVFSSKSRSPYTQLCISHLDEDGNDSPALYIPNSTADNRAANIPEFVAIDYGDLYDITIAGMEYQRVLKTARRHYNNGKLTDALAVLDSLLVTSPDDPKIRSEIITTMGDAYFVNGYADKAVDKFHEALDIDPECIMAVSTMGLLLEKLYRIDDALELYYNALDINPNDTTTLFQLANLRRTAINPAYQDFDEAVTLLEHASQVTNYRDVGIMGALAESYAAAGNFDRALEEGGFVLDLCHDNGLIEYAETFEKRMDLFRKGRLY